MSRRLFLPVTFAACMLAAAGPLHADHSGMVLQPSVLEKLPPEAMGYYKQAQVYLDKVDYPAAIMAMSKAAEMAPGSIDLQFMVEEHARKEAELSYEEASIALYEVAEKATSRLLANPDLGVEDKLRLERERKLILKQKNEVPARDKARRTTAQSLLLSIRDERLAAAGIAEMESPTGKAGAQKGGATASSSKTSEGAEIDPFAKAPGEFMEGISQPIEAIGGMVVSATNPMQSSAPNPFGGADATGAAPPAPAGPNPFAAGGDDTGPPAPAAAPPAAPAGFADEGAPAQPAH